MLPQELLQQLMEPFGLPAKAAEFVSLSQNYVYKVHHGTGVTIVRISKDRHRERSHIEAELAWIRGLVEKGVRASHPIPTTDGNYCHEMTADDCHYLVSCFEHAPGKAMLRSETGEAGFEKLGRLAGQLHAASASDNRANVPLCRPLWHRSRLLNEDFHENAEVIPERMRYGVDRLISELKKIPQYSHNFGLIHGDLSFGNFHESQGETWLYDFDNCEYGYFLQDLAVILYWHW